MTAEAQIRLAAAALRPTIEALGLTMEGPDRFRSWDDDNEVCTVVEIRSMPFAQVSTVDVELGFVSRYCSLMMAGNIVPNSPDLGWTIPDMQFSAQEFGPRPKGGLPVDSIHDFDQSIAVYTDIINDDFRCLTKRLRTLDGWGSYIWEIFDSRPPAQHRLLSLLVYVLIKTGAPVDEVIAAYKRHFCLKERLPYHLERQRKVILEHFGLDVANQ
jgi:hypothetical protein